MMDTAVFPTKVVYNQLNLSGIYANGHLDRLHDLSGKPARV